MEHAKKLILVEPRVLEQLQVRNEYKELEKPVDKKSKSDLSLEMKRILEEDEGDDIKAKKYRQSLSRFLNLKSKLPTQENTKINRLTVPSQQTPVRPSRKRRKSQHWLAW